MFPAFGRARRVPYPPGLLSPGPGITSGFGGRKGRCVRCFPPVQDLLGQVTQNSVLTHAAVKSSESCHFCCCCLTPLWRQKVTGAFDVHKGSGFLSCQVLGRECLGRRSGAGSGVGDKAGKPRVLMWALTSAGRGCPACIRERRFHDGNQPKKHW